MSESHDEAAMASWRSRKASLKATRAVLDSVKAQAEIKATKEWRRLAREAREAAQRPDNLHDGFTR